MPPRRLVVSCRALEKSVDVHFPAQGPALLPVWTVVIVVLPSTTRMPISTFPSKNMHTYVGLN